ncbi:hypothetical protein [Kitasatospora sp. Ki12]
MISNEFNDGSAENVVQAGNVYGDINFVRASSGDDLRVACREVYSALSELAPYFDSIEHAVGVLGDREYHDGLGLISDIFKASPLGAVLASCEAALRKHNASFELFAPVQVWSAFSKFSTPVSRAARLYPGGAHGSGHALILLGENRSEIEKGMAEFVAAVRSLGVGGGA